MRQFLSVSVVMSSFKKATSHSIQDDYEDTEEEVQTPIIKSEDSTQLFATNKKRCCVKGVDSFVVSGFVVSLAALLVSLEERLMALM